MQSTEERFHRRFVAAAQIGNTEALRTAIAEFAATRPAVEAWRNIASEMMSAGYPDPALYVLEAASEQNPQSAELRYLAANAFRVTARHDMAERQYRDALRLMTSHRDAALAFAFMLRQLGRIEAATQVISDSLANRQPEVGETLAALNFLRECGSFGAADRIAREAFARWPDNATVAAHAGEFALAVGDFSRATSALREALSRDPGKSAAWLRLALSERFTSIDEPDFAMMQNAWHNAALGATTRTCVGFALGKALDDLGQFEQAATTLREANAAARDATPWRAAEWNQFVAQKIASRGIARIDNDFAPVFIVGLPRTGTTLVATSLARDARVRDRGELNWIAAMHDSLREQNLLGDLASLKAAADVIETQMRRDDAPATFYIDKNPLNFRYLDLIAAMFPSARIVHCRREAHDTALSIWMQYFAHGDVGFAYDFASIADFMQGYERLTAHWQKTLKVPMLEVSYESLVADNAATLRKLGDFLGLQLQPSNADGGAIVTASAWQARQPVYASSVGRWKNYAPYVPELARLFG